MGRPLLTIAIVMAAALAPAAQSARTFDLLTASVADVQAAVDAGRLTYEQLVQLYLRRIAAYDKAGPKLNAVIAVNPNALTIARQLDEERRSKGRRSPLHGIPIAVKDTVDVSDITSAGGNVALKGTFPKHDATVVRKLREAGAIILLKANLDEFNVGAEGISSLGGAGSTRKICSRGRAWAGWRQSRTPRALTRAVWSARGWACSAISFVANPSFSPSIKSSRPRSTACARHGRRSSMA